MAKQALRPDIQAAVDRMPSKIGAGRELRKLPEYLADGEQIVELETGYYGKGNGLLVLTDRRLLFLLEGVMSSTSEDFPFGLINSIEFNSGIALGTVIVHSGARSVKIQNVGKNAGRRIVDQVRERLAAGAAPVPAAAPAGGADELLKLAELHRSGVLTDEEFAAAKAKLLG